MRKSMVAIVIWVLLPCFLFAQVNVNYNDAGFFKADSIAQKVRYEGDLLELTQKLTAPFSSQLLKTRAIFRWITENIRYDYKYYNKYPLKNKEPKTFTCKGNDDCEVKRLVWEMKLIDRTLAKKKAVCQGYAMLFKKMCDLAGIEAHVLVGYVRTEPYQIGSSGNLDHAWNAVRIDSNYYLLDVTWAAGGCSKDEETGKLGKFQKSFNSYYWLTKPEDFVRNHFPQEAKWTLIPNFTKQKFADNPYYRPDIISSIQLFTPNTGIIQAKQGDTIEFKFNYTQPFGKLQVNTNIFRNPDIWKEEGSGRKKKKVLDTFAIKKQQYVEFKKLGYDYEFNYVVPDNSLWYIDLLFDRQRLLRFKVKRS